MINREDLLSGTRPEVGARIFVTEMSGFDGYEVMDYKGIAWGISMRSKDVAQDFFMGCKQVTGGELTSYTELSDEVRQRALDRLLSMARRMGANAVINFRFSQNMMMYTQNNEVVAYGNAVVIRPIKNYVPTGGLGNILAEFVDAYTNSNNGNNGLSTAKTIDIPSFQQDKISIPEPPVQEGTTEGKIVRNESFAFICCPSCHTKYKLQTDAAGKNHIAGFEDVDDIEPGCQVHCFKCGTKFTIPNS